MKLCGHAHKQKCVNKTNKLIKKSILKTTSILLYNSMICLVMSCPMLGAGRAGR